MRAEACTKGAGHQSGSGRNPAFHGTTKMQIRRPALALAGGHTAGSCSTFRDGKSSLLRAQRHSKGIVNITHAGCAHHSLGLIGMLR